MKVLITRQIPDAGLKILSIYKDRLEIDYLQGEPLTSKELIKAVKGVDAIIPMSSDHINKGVMDAAGENLKIIATYSVGYDHIDVSSATEKKIYVGNTPGDLTEAVGEHALGLLFAVARHIPQGDKFCHENKYKHWEPMKFIGPQLMGKRIGIVGFGRIGQHVARMAKFGLNMNISYTDVISHPEAERLLDAKQVSLEELLGNSDVVVLSCNLTKETHHLIGTKQLKLMKPYAIIINVSRGQVINENALVTALSEEWIAGAGLDVFENEPNISTELLKLNNVVLTPHIASATWEARIQMSRMAAENVVDVLINQKPPRYIVNRELANNHVSSLS